MKNLLMVCTALLVMTGIIMQQQTALAREQQDAIRAQFGGKYPQYQEYLQTRPARTQVVTMGGQLAAAGQPLSDAQSRALTTAMIAEQQRQRQQATPPRS